MLGIKKAVFVFKDGYTKEFNLGSSIKGVKRGGERPTKVLLNFATNCELTDREKDNLYRGIIPALDPLTNEVIYEQ